MEIPSEEQERLCYKAFYDATSNSALQFRICPVCAREELASEGERTSLLTEPSIREVLVMSPPIGNSGSDSDMVVLGEYLERRGGEVICWMCTDCRRALERHILPKFALANNLLVGEVPFQLKGLTVPEQLLIARHYPRCYIFKLYPREYDGSLPSDQLYSGMAGNASLFELNTQEVVEMLRGQKMPSPVASLASVIAITFIGSKQLPMDWMKKTFRVRRSKVYEALTWLQGNNPLYADIHVDRRRLEELPDDDVPNELLSVVRVGDDEELVEKEWESYLNLDPDHMEGRDKGASPDNDSE